MSSSKQLVKTKIFKIFSHVSLGFLSNSQLLLNLISPFFYALRSRKLLILNRTEEMDEKCIDEAASLKLKKIEKKLEKN